MGNSDEAPHIPIFSNRQSEALKIVFGITFHATSTLICTLSIT